MTSLLLDAQYRVYPPRHRSGKTALAWDFDQILEGLVSGSITGSAMVRPDASMLLDLLSRLGWAPDASKLSGAIPYLVGRLDMWTLREVMRNLGYTSRLRRLRPRKMPDADVSCVLVCAEGQLWTVASQGDAQPVARRLSEFDAQPEIQHLRPNKSYSVIDFAPVAQDASATLYSKSYSFTAGTFARFAPDVRLAFLLTLFSGAMTIVLSVVVMFLFDLVVTGQEASVVAAVLVAAAGVFLLDLGFRGLKSRLLGRIAGRFEFILGAALFNKLVKLPRRMIDQASISDQTMRLRELEGMRDIFSGPFAMVALELPVTMLLLVAIAFLSPVLGLVLMGVILLFVILGLSVVPALVRDSARLSSARNALTRTQMELIRKRTFIARNGLAWPWVEKSRRAVNEVVSARFRLTRTASTLEALSYVFVPVAATSVIFGGAERAIAGLLSGGELVAITILTWRAAAPIQQGLLILPKSRDLMRLFRQVDAMMRFQEEEDLPDIGEGRQGACSITASNLFLRAPNAHVATLSGMSFEVPPGLLVATTGSSGAGKSVLLGVLSGQIQPQGGFVRLGDVRFSEMAHQAVAARIMHIPQRPLLIYGSLAQNLRFVDPLVSDAKIESVLVEVGLQRLVERLPEGIHSRIDPTVDINLLAGGARTAIALAQALLKNPEMLLLDEPTEDVDPVIDSAMFQAVHRRRGEMTSLIVTHRPSVIRASDAVLTISAGQARLEFNKHVKDQVV